MHNTALGMFSRPECDSTATAPSTVISVERKVGAGLSGGCVGGGGVHVGCGSASRIVSPSAPRCLVTVVVLVIS